MLLRCMLADVDTIRLLIRQRWHDNHQSIKTVFQAQPDVEIVGEVSEHVELLVAVRDTDADAVLMIIDPEKDEGMLSHLFAEYPDLTVLAIAAGADRETGDASADTPVFIEQRCRYRSQVTDYSPQGLADALCNAVREPFDLINPGKRRH